MLNKPMISLNHVFTLMLFVTFALSASPALFAQYVNPPTAPKVVEDAEPEADPADPAMQIPVDGSSLEAFDASLAKIKESATEASYTTLENAITYLLVYDLNAQRDRARLAKNLHGMTGDQIIAQVDWHKNG